ncbi:MAG TPA: SH3 domain-containing protein [Candidatus Omnitrophota bacterium]|nr:SH3 domain-containing protein [Candidatus Omnitrophota bacterium]
MKKLAFLVLIIFIGFHSSSYGQTQQIQAGPASTSYMEGLAPGESLPELPQSPLFLTGTTPEQLTPDYWINRLPDPDRPLKAPEQLKFFNKEIDMMLQERIDIFESGVLPSGTQIRNIIKSEYETVSNRKLFGIDDKYIPKSFFETQIKPHVDWETVPDKLSVKWGVATRATSVRALPTLVKMLEEKGDIEFDQLQFTLIKLWTQVAILHTSKDGEWYYVQAPYVRGWVKSKYVAIFPGKSALKEKVRTEKFLVITGESVSICQDSACLEEYQRPTMGTILPLVEQNAQGYVVEMPIRSSNGKAALNHFYIHRDSDVHIGFPAFTQRNIINQAFKLLGARYGWGGMYNGRDCSGFTHDVFLSMGVDLPRDSDQQALIGTQLGHFEMGENTEKKVGTLRESTPGITLLKMSLHMMLYLGEVDGRFFIIHSTWAERISMTSDEKNRINQVVVSDMSLNGHSYLGSLFDRTISINELD